MTCILVSVHLQILKALFVLSTHIPKYHSVSGSRTATDSYELFTDTRSSVHPVLISLDMSLWLTSTVNIYTSNSTFLCCDYYSMPNKRTTHLHHVVPGHHLTCSAYLYQPSTLEMQIKSILYDQYEVSVPVSSMADCLAGLHRTLYGDDMDAALESTR